VVRPKGFASLVYGLIVLASGIAAADEIIHLVALTIIVSIVAHSSIDVLVARLFDETTRCPRGTRPCAGGFPAGEKLREDTAVTIWEAPMPNSDPTPDRGSRIAGWHLRPAWLAGWFYMLSSRCCRKACPV
jgi:hypothetical protein